MLLKVCLTVEKPTAVIAKAMEEYNKQCVIIRKC